jgi:hypothetical protein
MQRGNEDNVMMTEGQSKLKDKSDRRPLYDSVWLAFFELLREELVLRNAATVNGGDSLSPPQ